ncbi:hypothetical protein [Streptomyces zhihengii]
MYAVLHALTPDVRRSRTRRAPARAARLLGTLTVTATALLGAAAPAAAAPVPAPVDAPGPVPVAAPAAPAELARTGSTAEQLWLLGGVALSLTAAGVVAVAASRGRKRDH